MWLLPSATITLCDYYTVWLLHSATITQCDYYPVRLLPTVTITQCDYYTVWLLHSATITQCDYYTVRLLHSPWCKISLPDLHNLMHSMHQSLTSPDGAVAKSNANGLVGTGFTSWYHFQSRVVFLKTQWVGVRPLHPLLYHWHLIKPNDTVLDSSPKSWGVCPGQHAWTLNGYRHENTVILHKRQKRYGGIL